MKTDIDVIFDEMKTKLNGEANQNLATTFERIINLFIEKYDLTKEQIDYLRLQCRSYNEELNK